MHTRFALAALAVLLAAPTSAQAPTLLSVRPGSSDSLPERFTAFGGMVYFVANDGTNGRELWKTDGTPGGTVLVKDIWPGSSSSNPANFAVLGGALYFSATDGVNGDELWRTDGTAAGTALVADIRPGAADGFPRQIAVFNGALVFRATDGATGLELWTSDGTAAGTVLLADILSGFQSSTPRGFTEFNGALYFQAYTLENEESLHKTDGTTAGTVLVSAVNTPSSFTPYNGALYFTARDGAGFELYRTDGTTAGTVLVRDINPGPGGSFDFSSPPLFQVFAGALYFRATDGSAGYEMWRTDGTAAGTVLVKDVNPGAASSFASGFTVVDGALFFFAADGVHGVELWRSDGTAAGTALFRDVRPGPSDGVSTFVEYSSILPRPPVLDGVMYFSGNDGENGAELWRTDGTASGTYMAANLFRNNTGSSPNTFAALGGRLYFSAFGFSGGSTFTGAEPWVLNASPQETTVTIAGGAGWRMLSAPVAGLTVEYLSFQNLVQGVSGSYPQGVPNLFTGYTGAGTAAGYTAPASTSAVLTSGRGFIWYFFNQSFDPTPGGSFQKSYALPAPVMGAGSFSRNGFDFEPSTTPVTADIPVPLHAAGDRFNLVGNPFAQPLGVSGLASWAQGGTLASAVAQVYDPALPGYRLSTSPALANTIAVWQGFFVENGPGTVAAPAASLLIPYAARTTGGTFFRDPAEAPGLVEFALDGTATDGTPVRDRSAQLFVHPDAGAEWDLWDASKLSPLSSPSASLWFVGERDGATVAKAQESRAPAGGAFEVPLAVEAVGTAGEMVLSWPHVTVPASWRLVLRDVVTGAVVDLRGASSYAFTASSVSRGTEALAAPAAGRTAAGAPRFVLRVDPGGSTAGEAEAPAETALAGAFPNPAGSQAEVRYTLAEAGAVTITVHDLLGREVARLADGEQAAGSHAVRLETRGLASGVYVVRMTAPGGFVAVRRITIVR